MEGKIQVEGMLKEGIGLGLKNVAPIVVNVLLWVLTCWIPYINIGTTIAIFTLPAKIAKGEGLAYTEIFNPAYRKNMGEFFLLIGFMASAIGIASITIVGGIVIGIAWSLAILLLADKGLDPIAAIRKSNELTMGNKLAIFFGQLVVGVVVGIAGALVTWLVSLIGVDVLTGIIYVAFMVVFMSIMMGVNAYIYKRLALEA